MTLDWEDGDRIWERLAKATDAAGEEADAFLARLVLLLANEVGDAEQIMRAIDEAVEE